MKVKELIDLLKEQDPEKDVMIQQNEDYDYMHISDVCRTELTSWENDELVNVVVINYQ